MAVEFILSKQVTNTNGNEYGWPNNPNGFPQGQLIPCNNSEIVASYWRIPQYQGNRITGYAYVIAQETTTKPQPDALKVLRVKLTNYAGIETLDMAILDTDNVSYTSPPNQYVYLCNGLGGTVPVMPLVTIPVPMQQSYPQSSTNGLNTFIFSFPTNPLGLTYVLNGAWFNSALPYAAYVPSGITTVALFVTWANTNWGDYGTFTRLSDTTLQLVSNVSSPPSTVPVYRAGISMDLTPVDFCFDLTGFGTPSLITGFAFGSGIIPFKVPFLLTTDPIVLMNQLIPVMSSGTIFDATSVAHKLGINTTMATPKLYNGSTLVATAASGSC